MRESAMIACSFVISLAALVLSALSLVLTRRK